MQKLMRDGTWKQIDDQFGDCQPGDILKTAMLTEGQYALLLYPCLTDDAAFGWIFKRSCSLVELQELSFAIEMDFKFGSGVCYT